MEIAVFSTPLSTLDFIKLLSFANSNAFFDVDISSCLQNQSFGLAICEVKPSISQAHQLTPTLAQENRDALCSFKYKAKHKLFSPLVV